MFKVEISLLFRMLLVSLLISLSFGSLILASGEPTVRITGTYSDMRFIKEAGDVLGTEIKIVHARDHFQGALQFAEGAPEELTVVNIESSGSSIQFVIPDGNPYAGKFSGTIENGWLRGEFHFKSGGENKVALRKGKSYWD